MTTKKISPAIPTDEKTINEQTTCDKDSTGGEVIQGAINIPAQILDKQNRITEAERFFNLLYGAVSERKYGYLWAKRADEKITYPFDVSNPHERKTMAQKAIELNDAGFDVYYGVNLMDTPPAPYERATKETVTLQTAIGTDIDVEGGTHTSSEKKKYPSFDVAKGLLPFTPSILINSGYGYHGLNLYATPLAITADNRKLAVQRNKTFIDIIRNRAGEFSKAVDGVGDLPRVLRVPGTRNYKLGISDDSPICHIVEVNDVRFSPEDIDKQLDALKPVQKTKERPTPTRKTVFDFADDSPDFKEFRIRKMLEVIRVADLSREDWLNVGMALKNNGNTCADWEQWSRPDERFKDGECDRLWQGFNGSGLTIATIHDLAKQYGYSEKDTQREWYQLHPDKKPSTRRTIEEQPAQITNTPENFNGEIYMTGLLEDLDNGRRLAKFCSDRVKWVTDTERWLIWDIKGVWIHCSEKNSCLAPEVSRFADLMLPYAIKLASEAEKFSQAYLEISTEKDGRVKTNATPEAKDAEKKMKKANEKKEKALAIARDFRKVKKVSCAITMMKGVEDILITAEDLDNHPNLINCLNYVVDLQDKKLYPHTETRLKLITQQCRAAYIPDAKSELVDSFFKAIQPDEMTCAGLLRWLGYCLTGEVSEEKFMVHTGDGGNGKGVLSATVLELLASYGVGLAPTALLKSNKPIDADKASTALNGIELARFAISEEMPADGELDTSLIKNLTGGDRINLRKLYSEYRTVKPTAKINISGNYTPKIENVHDGGLLRRMLNMPYLVKFGTPNNPADHNLKKKMFLPENLNALLRLLVDEAFNWYRDGLIISPQMAQETKRHLAQNDFIADFIDDNETYERGANFTVKAKEFIDALKREYPRECSRFKRNDLIKLIAETDGITYTTDRTRARVFRGIGKKGAPQQQSFDDFDGEPISPDDLQP